MSTAEIERFAGDLNSNAALRAEAEKAQADKSHANPMALAVAFAASKGYAFTVDEMTAFAKATVKAAGRELADAELAGVAAGANSPGFVDPFPIWTKQGMPGGGQTSAVKSVAGGMLVLFGMDPNTVGKAMGWTS